MPKSYKRKFGTKEEIINQIYHKGNGWIKNKKINKHNDSPFKIKGIKIINNSFKNIINYNFNLLN